MGCYDLNTRTYEKENLIFRSCIGNFRDLSVDFYLELFTKYEAGEMPYNKTFQDQPAKIIEVFKVIANIRDKLAKESAKYGKRDKTRA